MHTTSTEEDESRREGCAYLIIYLCLAGVCAMALIALAVNQ